MAPPPRYGRPGRSFALWVLAKQLQQAIRLGDRGRAITLEEESRALRAGRLEPNFRMLDDRGMLARVGGGKRPPKKKQRAQPASSYAERKGR